MSELKKVEIFTDGACSGNPGPGGWGAVLRYGEHEAEMSGGDACTTNNRMELMAVISAVDAAKGALRYKDIYRLAVCCQCVFKRLDMELEKERMEKIRQEAGFESRALGEAAEGALEA